jgi:hypothetical protein
MGDVERPLVASWLGGFFQTQLFPHGCASLGVGRLDPEQVCPENFFQDFEHWHEAYQALDDDSPFVIGAAFPGIPWMEAILGCPIYASEETIWSEPWLEDFGQVDIIESALDGPWFAKLIEFTKALVRHARGRYPVGTTLMRGISDMLGAVRGQVQSVYDLYDHPQEIRRLAGLCADIWLQVARAQLEILTEFYGGHASGCWGFKVWAPGRCIWFQEDGSAFLSPSLFEDFVWPHDQRIASAVEHSFMHLHSPNLYPLPQVMMCPDLTVIEINYDEVGPKLEELLPAFGEVLNHKPLLINGYMSDDEIDMILERLPYRGLCLQPVVATVDEGRRVFQRIAERAAQTKQA